MAMPRGSKDSPGLGTPNKKTALVNAAFDAATRQLRRAGADLGEGAVGEVGSRIDAHVAGRWVLATQSA